MILLPMSACDTSFC